MCIERVPYSYNPPLYTYIKRLTEFLCVCRCCKVCARVEGEPCGGLFGFSGTCAVGLQCVIMNLLTRSREMDEGVCTSEYSWENFYLNRDFRTTDRILSWKSNVITYVETSAPRVFSVIQLQWLEMLMKLSSIWHRSIAAIGQTGSEM